MNSFHTSPDKGLALLPDLTQIKANPTPTPVVFAAFFLPWLLCYLVHLPGTRMYRIGLLPPSLMAAAWCMLGDNQSWGPNNRLRFAQFSLHAVLGGITRYTFTDRHPSYLPRTPAPLHFIRRTTAFKAFDLLANQFRRIGLTPGDSTSTKRSYFGGVVHHLSSAVLYMFLFDLFTYLPFRIAPTTFGSPELVGGDFTSWCANLAASSGVPVGSVWLFWGVCLAGIVYVGQGLTFHLLATILVASGLYRSEEWPDLYDKPFTSTSLRELWSVRYSQLLRYSLRYFASPLSFLPRPIYIFLIFQLSGLFHIFLYYPLHHEIVVRPYAIFYITQGLAMALERQYYKTTGRKVGGVIGWFWTWGVIALSGMPTVEHEYGIGWAGAMRGPFAEDRSNSMVEWLVYALGLGRHPKE